MTAPPPTAIITSHGRRYHDPDRHHMTGSGTARVTISYAQAHGYLPCAYCYGTPPARPAIGRNPSRPYLDAARTARGGRR